MNASLTNVRPTSAEGINLQWLAGHVDRTTNLSGKDVIIVQASHHSMHWSEDDRLLGDPACVPTYCIHALNEVARIVFSGVIPTIENLPPYRFGTSVIVTPEVLGLARAIGRPDGDLYIIDRPVYDQFDSNRVIGYYLGRPPG